MDRASVDLGIAVESMRLIARCCGIELELDSLLVGRVAVK